MNYNCDICNIEFKFPSKLKEHQKTKGHKIRSGPPLKFECKLCGYWSYEKKNYRQHKRKHMKNDNYKLKQIIIKSNKEEQENLKNDDFIGDRELLKKEIGRLVIECYKNKIDPNEHFNYGYYCNRNINLDIYELNDFYQELKSIL